MASLVLFLMLGQARGSMPTPTSTLSLALLTLVCSALSLYVRGLRKVVGRMFGCDPRESRSRPYWVRDPSSSHRLSPSPSKRRATPQPPLAKDAVSADDSTLQPRNAALRWLNDREETADIPAWHHQAGVGVEGEMPWDSPFAPTFFSDSPPNSPKDESGKVVTVAARVCSASGGAEALHTTREASSPRYFHGVSVVLERV